MKGRLVLGAAVALAIATSQAVGGISGGGKVAASSSELLIIGPVEAVKEKEGFVVVLGQRLPLKSVGHVEVGETLAVFGSARADGALNVAGAKNLGMYVPGATNVLLTAVVQKV